MAFFNGANVYLPPTPVAPGYLLIAAITQSNPMVVTVEDQQSYNIYIVGQLVYLSVPFDYGMFQANALTGQILAINGLNFTLSINSSQFDPFVPPSSNYMNEAPATLSPAGSRNTYNFTTLPFHSAVNYGN